MATCPAIVNLFLRVVDPASFLPVLDTMAIQRLSVDLSALFNHTSPITGADLHHSLFTFVTHLDVLDEDYESRWLPAFANSPSLQLPGASTPLTAEPPSAPSLHSMWIRRMRWSLRRKSISRLRTWSWPHIVIIMLAGNSGRGGGADLWVLAENFLERKRRGRSQVSFSVRVMYPVAHASGQNTSIFSQTSRWMRVKATTRATTDRMRSSE